MSKLEVGKTYHITWVRDGMEGPMQYIATVLDKADDISTAQSSRDGFLLELHHCKPSRNNYWSDAGYAPSKKFLLNTSIKSAKKVSKKGSSSLPGGYNYV